MLAIYQIYEKVMCCVRMSDKLLDFFIALLVLSKDAHSHKPYLVHICIDESEEMVAKFVKEKYI